MRTLKGPVESEKTLFFGCSLVNRSSQVDPRERQKLLAHAFRNWCFQSVGGGQMRYCVSCGCMSGS